MLIKTDRHTKEDLELWEEMESADKVRGISKSKIDFAIKMIQECCEKKSYVSVSWGKDSIVVAHLCYVAGVKIPMVWIKEKPMHNEYCCDVRDKFLQKFPFQYHEIVADYSTVGFCQFLDKNGDSHLFHNIADAVNKTFGRRITGIRNDESGRRLVRYMSHGINTPKTSAPISLWSNNDVFSYLAKYDLPVHPNYAMLGSGRYPRNKIRVDCFCGTQGNSFGRAEWEYEYYPDVVNRIKHHETMACS